MKPYKPHTRFKVEERRIITDRYPLGTIEKIRQPHHIDFPQAIRESIASRDHSYNHFIAVGYGLMQALGFPSLYLFREEAKGVTTSVKSLSTLDGLEGDDVLAIVLDGNYDRLFLTTALQAGRVHKWLTDFEYNPTYVSLPRLKPQGKAVNDLYEKFAPQVPDVRLETLDAFHTARNRSGYESFTIDLKEFNDETFSLISAVAITNLFNLYQNVRTLHKVNFSTCLKPRAFNVLNCVNFVTELTTISGTEHPDLTTLRAAYINGLHPTVKDAYKEIVKRNAEAAAIRKKQQDIEDKRQAEELAARRKRLEWERSPEGIAAAEQVNQRMLAALTLKG